MGASRPLTAFRAAVFIAVVGVSITAAALAIAGHSRHTKETPLSATHPEACHHATCAQRPHGANEHHLLVHVVGAGRRCVRTPTTTAPCSGAPSASLSGLPRSLSLIASTGPYALPQQRRSSDVGRLSSPSTATPELAMPGVGTPLFARPSLTTSMLLLPPRWGHGRCTAAPHDCPPPHVVPRPAHPAGTVALTAHCSSSLLASSVRAFLRRCLSHPFSFVAGVVPRFATALLHPSTSLLPHSLDTHPDHVPSREYGRRPFAAGSHSVLDRFVFVSNVFLQAHAAPVNTTTVTVCAFASSTPNLINVALSVGHAVRHYGRPDGAGFGRFPPTIAWRFRLLGDGALTRRNYIQAWTLSSSNGACPEAAVASTPAPESSLASVPLLTTTLPCDALVGPGYSFLAQAVSPVVDRPTVWVDPSASAATLSNKEEYPFFSRVFPSDVVGATLGIAVLRRFGWTDVNLLCLDDAYGRSVFQEMSGAVTAMGGRVHYARCLLTDATAEQMLAELRRIQQQSPSRLIFMAMLPGTAFTRLMNVIRENGFDEHFVFFFSEAACATTPPYYAELKSALCVTYAPNNTKIAAVEAAYKARNTTADVEALRAQGATVPASMDLTETALLWSMAHDAASHAMAAAVTKLGNASMSGADAVRATTTAGASGTVRLLANGDRPSAAAVVYNALGQQRHRAVGYIDDGALVFTRADGAPDPSAAAPVPLLLFKATAATVPAVRVPATPVPGPDRTSVVVIGSALGVAVVAFAAAVAAYFGVAAVRRRRFLRRCPSDPDVPFAAFFVSVKNEAQLRDDLGAAAAEAICHRVEAIVDRAAAGAECCVARRLDAHFLVLATTPQAAVTATAAIAVALHRQNWARYATATHLEEDDGFSGRSGSTAFRRPAALHHPRAAHESPGSESLRGAKTHGSGPWSNPSTSARGSSAHPPMTVPSVSIGCSFGLGRIKRIDAATGLSGVPFRYSGEPVEHAAGLADMARGGQVLCSGAVHDAVLWAGAGTAGSGQLQEFGLKALPGTDTVLEVYELDVAGIPSANLEDSCCPSHPDTPRGAAGGVLSALEAASGGLATRNVAVVAVRVAAMARRHVPAATADAAVAAVSTAAAPLKGRVVMVLDATVYVAVNAVGHAVSQASTRAATIALGAVAAVEAATGAPASAGIEFGPCAAGAVAAAKETAKGPRTGAGGESGGLVVANSNLGARAAALARLAEAGPCRVVAADAVHSELRVSYALLTVDLLAYPAAVLPGPPTPQRATAMKAHSTPSRRHSLPVTAGSPTVSPRSHSPAPYLAVGGRSSMDARPRVSVRPVHGVLRPHGDDGLAADAEWMYRLSDLDAGDPHAVSNAAFAAMVAGDDPAALMRRQLNPRVERSFEADSPSGSNHPQSNANENNNSNNTHNTEDNSKGTTSPPPEWDIEVRATSVVEAIRRCPGATFASKVEVYAEWRSVSVTAMFLVAMPGASSDRF